VACLERPCRLQRTGASLPPSGSFWNGGAEVNIRGGKYGSALNAAVVNGLWHNVEVLLAAGATPDCRLMATPDEDWLRTVVETEEDGEGAVERYRVFWDVEKKGEPGLA